MRKFLTCADQNSLCLIIIELKFIVCHPVFNVGVTLRCAGQEGLYVFRGGTVLKLGIICIEMMLKRVGFDDCRQGRGVKSEEISAGRLPVRSSPTDIQDRDFEKDCPGNTVC